MPWPCPHRLALFSLRPFEENERAKRLVSHSSNEHTVSILSDGVLALDVGFHLRGKSSTTLATLGRGVDTDIYVEGSGIVRVQCSFEIDLDTGVVMLYDRSFANSTQVSGENAMPFEREREGRKVLVQKGLNTIIGMGGERRDLVQFELEWHQNPAQTAETIKNYNTLPCGRVENPRLARTIDEASTDLPSRRETRPHTPGQRPLKMRYVKTEEPLLGAGTYGAVHKVIDVDSGKLMAVKILQRPTRPAKQEQWKSLDFALKREVEILSRINHPYIVDYIWSQGWGEPQLYIFMGLKEGNLEVLLESRVDVCTISESVFFQMLQALDYIASMGIVHRDIKPANILYKSLPEGRYEFQLGDFGLCNRISLAKTVSGSPLYMAPEMFLEGPQTHKVDVWSLFVTMLWTSDAGMFRQKADQLKNVPEIQRAVLHIAANDITASKIREMAIADPEERASAAQMLVKHYNGEGLSTPRNRVPALASDAPPKIAATRAPAPAPLAFAAQTPQRNARGLQTNVFAAAAPYRVEKARDPRQPQPPRRLQEIRRKPQNKS